MINVAKSRAVGPKILRTICTPSQSWLLEGQSWHSADVFSALASETIQIAPWALRSWSHKPNAVQMRGVLRRICRCVSDLMRARNCGIVVGEALVNYMRR